MSFLEVLDIFSNLAFSGDNGNRTKQPKIYILFYILLIPSLFWLVTELKEIMTLSAPTLFLVLAITIGLIMTAGVIILIYRLKLIEALRSKELLLILIPITSMTVSFASYLNRTYEIMLKNLDLKF
jgi:hypothetical protein